MSDKMINKLVAIIKVRRSLVISVSIILTAIIYIYSPFFDPTIEINASSELLHLDIELPRKFTQCTLTFDNEIPVSSYSMSLHSKNDIGKVRAREEKEIDQKINTLIIKNLTLNNRRFSDDNEGLDIRIKVSFNTNTPFEITKVSVDGKKQDIQTFYENNLFYKYKKINKYNFIRDDISRFLLNYNDYFSNIILTLLFIYLFPLAFDLTAKSARLYKKNKLREYLHDKYNLSSESEINNAAIAYAEFYTRMDSWYRLLQVMGPAIGFTLTISSLIAGLHPSLQKIQNIKVFFEIIQVAMVSTFLGLLVRIMSIYLQRINNKLLMQTDEILFELKEKVNSDVVKSD